MRLVERDQVLGRQLAAVAHAVVEPLGLDDAGVAAGLVLGGAHVDLEPPGEVAGVGRDGHVPVLLVEREADLAAAGVDGLERPEELGVLDVGGGEVDAREVHLPGAERVVVGDALVDAHADADLLVDRVVGATVGDPDRGELRRGPARPRRLDRPQLELGRAGGLAVR